MGDLSKAKLAVVWLAFAWTLLLLFLYVLNYYGLMRQ
jgi:hypothetical protein